MKVKRNEIREAMFLNVLAELYDLTLVIECYADWTPRRYTAKFEDVEVKDGQMLSGTYGDGPSEHAAIEEYCRCISLRTLVYRAGSQTCRKDFTTRTIKWHRPGNEPTYLLTDGVIR